MSDNSPPIKKLKKMSSEVSTSKIDNFLDDIATIRKQVSKSCK